MKPYRVSSLWVMGFVMFFAILVIYTALPLIERHSVEHRVDGQQFYAKLKKTGKLDLPDPALISSQRQDFTEGEGNRETFDTARAWDLEDRDYL